MTPSVSSGTRNRGLAPAVPPASGFEVPCSEGGSISLSLLLLAWMPCRLAPLCSCTVLCHLAVPAEVMNISPLRLLITAGRGEIKCAVGELGVGVRLGTKLGVWGLRLASSPTPMDAVAP